ncbi:hypothetical protein [Psychrobacter sp. DAB_AL43B]|uniref:Thoeris anti-defense Tad2 family protein n=1 Tax=Psychrobacter sp. DAB_AL43B TaxID=1028416 RepID=UPI0009A7B4D9|nr:hypothetical protein [Psychrobacter sp. DAB_AL43B]SLJ84503.1 hypothetical protein DABAL43B_1307 [Psychrobacter sp. DAB_AL43B]
MKIEELMPQIRAGEKVRMKAWLEGDFMYFVENAKDKGNFISEGNYTGFIAMHNGTECQSTLDGASAIADDWELYDG